jgi:hypothetical protein
MQTTKEHGNGLTVQIWLDTQIGIVDSRAILGEVGNRPALQAKERIVVPWGIRQTIQMMGNGTILVVAEIHRMADR